MPSSRPKTDTQGYSFKTLFRVCRRVAYVLGVIWILQVAWFTGYYKCREKSSILSWVHCAIVESYDFDAKFVRRLPSDEEMIANFHKHRRDLERLVEIYRTAPPADIVHRCLSIKPETKALMERSNISLICSDNTIWIPPDPYSMDAKRDMTIEIKTKLERGDLAARKLCSIVLYYDHGTVVRLIDNLPRVRKVYYYTPMVPKVRNGRLVTPWYDRWLFPTLNRYPSELSPPYLAFRQIAAQWFIRLSHGE